MLNEREQDLCNKDKTRPRSIFLSSYFVSYLLDESEGKGWTSVYTYENVKRWTRKKGDVFEAHWIYFPVNTENKHWTLLVLDMHKKEVHYYDSLEVVNKDRRKLCYETILRWLKDEAKEKHHIKDYDISVWKQGWLRDEAIEEDQTDDYDKPVIHECPKQDNGYDCGVFTMMYADFLTDNLPLDFEQKDMPHFRKKIAADILRGSLQYNDC